MGLLKELFIKVIIIIAITDVVEFYVINKKHQGVISVPLAIGIIVITIIPILIGIWFSLHKRGIK